MASNGQLVGIFSREAREAYDWLISSLLTISAVRDVRTVHISNTNYRDVIYEADKCTFAILYHTKNRGRINITDVTDSLYDRELEDLSRCLGRDRVIVVIDDLEDSSLEAKNLILQNQPSIGRWAVELFLFNDQEKTYQRRPLEDNKMAQMETLIKNKISRQDYSVYIGNDYLRYAIWITIIIIIILILVIWLAAHYTHKAVPTSSPPNASTGQYTTIFSSISPTTLPSPGNLTLSRENASTVP